MKRLLARLALLLCFGSVAQAQAPTPPGPTRTAARTTAPVAATGTAPGAAPGAAPAPARTAARPPAVAPPVARAPASDDWSACRRAIAMLEPGSGLPPGLLGAIALVESGRPVPGAGRAEPWPWAYNAAGDGHVPRTKQAAMDEVLALLLAGTRSVDVGCMQINLLNHPTAFNTLDEAFDPVANVRYAIRFLQGLRNRSGDWGVAVGRYHSGEPERGMAYSRRVAMMQLGKAWDTGGAVTLPPAVAPSCASGYVATLLVGGPQEARRFLTAEAQRNPRFVPFITRPHPPRFACLRAQMAQND